MADRLSEDRTLSDKTLSDKTLSDKTLSDKTLSDRESNNQDLCDRDLSDRVEFALHHSGYRDLRHLRCEIPQDELPHSGILSEGTPDGGVPEVHVSKGAIRLVGHVGNYFLKQMAQTVAARVPGVTQVMNQLRVS